MSQESCAYFHSWLEFGQTEDCICSKPVVAHEIGKGICHMQTKLDGLYSALVGCYEVINHHSTSPLDQDDFQKYWDEVKTLVGSISAEVDDIDCHWVEVAKEDDDSGSKLPRVSSGDSAQAVSRPLEVDEYGVDGTPNDAEIESFKDNQGQNKVFVYSGNGNGCVPKRPRKEVIEPYPRSGMPAIVVGAEQQLMQELRRHLRSLPSVEEMHVNSSERSSEPEIKKNKDDGNGTRKEHRKSRHDVFPLDTGKAASFIAELNRAIPAGTMQTSDGKSLCYEDSK
jgi:hypothetical protein